MTDKELEAEYLVEKLAGRLETRTNIPTLLENMQLLIAGKPVLKKSQVEETFEEYKYRKEK